VISVQIKAAKMLIPWNVRTYLDRGALKVGISRHQKASEQMETGFRLDQEHAEGSDTFGRVYHQLGQETGSRDPSAKFQPLKAQTHANSDPF
jgi:hypothetical protein